MSSLSMATAVWARNCAGAAASREAMPIAATVKYRLALSLMGALLVHVVFVSSREGYVCSPHALRAQAKILHSPCRPAISLVEAGFRTRAQPRPWSRRGKDRKSVVEETCE